MGKICVLRLGHRLRRDPRITTHVFLVARALGATEAVLCGDDDPPVLQGVMKVADLWGGSFKVRYEKSWKSFLLGRKREGWKVVHLTMYGESFEEKIGKVKKENVVVVVGAGKVPGEVYRISDYNLAVTNQPHSEIGALCLFLDRYFGGKQLRKKFDGKLKIVPNKCGKVVQHVRND
jgi:tRNA (cytidine56-2'-O)-methyltransferase